MRVYDIRSRFEASRDTRRVFTVFISDLGVNGQYVSAAGLKQSEKKLKGPAACSLYP